jgi:hypothetical protein
MATRTKVGAEQELNQLNNRRKQNAPELARQAKQKRAKRADGDIHSVDRKVARSRTQEADAATEVSRGPEKRWQRPSSLPGLPNPPGYELLWARKDNQARGDNVHLMELLQEGWEFARRSDFPGRILPTQSFQDHGEIIGNGSTVLLKMPERLVAERNAHYNKQRDEAANAIRRPNPGMSNHKSMPIVEDKMVEDSGFVRTGARRRQAQPAADDT